MITLVSDNETTAPIVEANNDPLKELFVNHQQGMSSDPLPVTQPLNPLPQQTFNNGAPPVIEYYKTGKKAGQPKPNRNYNQNRQPIPTQVHANPPLPTSMPGSNILTGAMFVFLIDLIFPMIIEVVNNRFSKKKIKGDQLRMTDQQKKEIAPIADQVVKQLNILGDPKILLLLSLAGIYGVNFMAVKAAQA